MSTTNKLEALSHFLLKEFDNKPESVKRFASNLRTLEIINLSDIRMVSRIDEDGGARLLTLVSWEQFGILDKLVNIKQHFKET